MCCRMDVHPLEPDIAKAVLDVGQFVSDNNGTVWRRVVGETTVTAFLTDPTKLTLSLSPAITADVQHEGRRDAAGVYFEIAAKYAEKVSGEVSQCSTIASCGSESNRVIASYPSQPLLFEAVCPGFARVFLNTGDELYVPSADDELFQTW